MKVIIAGSRSIKDPQIVLMAISESGFDITEVVSGGAVGVDRIGEAYARRNKIPIKHFLPDWSLGKGAGFIRNGEMAKYADALIAVWDRQSHGTLNMIKQSYNLGKSVFVLTLGLDGDGRKVIIYSEIKPLTNPPKPDTLPTH